MKTVTLKKPIQLTEADAPVTQLNFREDICAGDYRGIKVMSLSDPEMDLLMKIASRLCGQDALLLNKLGNEDMWEVARLVRGFMNAGLETGNTP